MKSTHSNHSSSLLTRRSFASVALIMCIGLPATLVYALEDRDCRYVTDDRYGCPSSNFTKEDCESSNCQIAIWSPFSFRCLPRIGFECDYDQEPGIPTMVEVWENIPCKFSSAKGSPAKCECNHPGGPPDWSSSVSDQCSTT